MKHADMSHAPEPPDAPDWPGKVLSPLLWGYGLGAATIVMQLGTTAILARLLEPSAFGQIAAAAAILRFLQYVSDLGLTSALIREGARFSRVSLSLSLAMVAANIVLAVAIWFAAPLLIGLMQDAGDNGVAILRMLAVGPVLTAIGQVSYAHLQFRLAFRTIGLAGLLAQLSGSLLVAIPMAMAGAGVWSLATGSLVQACVLAAFFIYKAPPSWKADGAVLPFGIFRLGLKFMALRILDAAGQAVLPLAIAMLAGITATGFYDRVYVLTVVILEWLAHGTGRIMQPVLVQAREDGEPAIILSDALLIGGSILLAVSAGIVASSDLLIAAVLGDRWRAAIGLMGLLAGWAALRGLAVICGSTIEALGSLALRAGHQAAYLFILCAALVLVRPDTAEAIMMLVLGIEILNIAAFLFYSSAVAGITLSRLAAILMQMLVAPLAVYLLLAAIRPLIAPLPVVAALFVAIVAAAATLICSLLWHPSGALRQRIRLYLAALSYSSTKR
jgi:lipopolysaccharide exporter